MRREWQCESSVSQGWDGLQTGGFLQVVREPSYSREYGAWFFSGVMGGALKTGGCACTAAHQGI
eukprot:9157986-Pyramimonas_sp.AAC.1